MMTREGLLTVATLCQPGFQISYTEDQKTGVCVSCPLNYYSLGAQSICMKCSLKAQLFTGDPNFVNELVDKLCPESSYIVEVVTDTIR